MKRTKILATYGPAIASSTKVARLVAAGVDALRVNCSHGKTSDLLTAARTIQQGCQKAQYPVALLFDLAGPKLRLERFDGKVQVSKGSRITLQAGKSHPSKRVLAVNHAALIESLKKKDRVLIDDGQIMFEVLSADDRSAVLKALNRGTLLPGKGINLPRTKLKIPTITEKDREDIKTAVRVDADFVGISFVRSADDIGEARRLIKKLGGHQKIIAKLEKPEAIRNLESIMKAADGVMIARGDLGVELPAEEVPGIQRKIIRLASCHMKPVIVATQMLESMRHAPRPTRAEVSDVAMAVFEGVDAVMLSAETATGEYPLETVKTMAAVIREAEKEPSHYRPDANLLIDKTAIPMAIVRAVMQANQICSTRAIVAFTSSGFTAQLISKLTPDQPIVALTDDKRVQRRGSLLRSVYAVQAEQPRSFSDMLDTVNDITRRQKLARKKERVIVTGGVPFGKRTPTNLLFIHEVS